MSDLSNRGADCILFGCTEIDLLVGRQDSPVPVFDTTRLHAQKAVQLALEGNAAQRPLARSGARPLSSADDG